MFLSGKKKWKKKKHFHMNHRDQVTLNQAGWQQVKTNRSPMVTKKRVTTSPAWTTHRPLGPDSPGTTVTSETRPHPARSGLCCLLCCSSGAPHPPGISVSSLSAAHLRLFSSLRLWRQDFHDILTLISNATSPNQVRVDLHAENTADDYATLP